MDKVIVYRETDEDGNHCYFFFDGKNRVELDWGETGFVPNVSDRFPHPGKDIDLILDELCLEE